eukprot:974314_1
MASSESNHYHRARRVRTKAKRIPLFQFIVENFASPIFVRLYKIECKVNDKLMKRNHPSANEPSIFKTSRTKAMMCIHELTKWHAKNALHSLSIDSGHNICDVCCLPKDIIRQILEFAYNIDNDLLQFQDMNIQTPFVDKMPYIPAIINIIEFALNILIFVCYLHDYVSWYHTFASIQYILTLCHLFVCHASFFVNASLPFNVLVQWNIYYRMYKGTRTCYTDYNLLRKIRRLLLIPYQQWMNIKSLNIARCAANDYIWVSLKSYNYCIYTLIMHHVTSLFLTPTASETSAIRQNYVVVLYMLPLLCMNS